MSTEQSPAETQPSTPPSDDQTVTLHHGDLFDELQKLDDESVHAVVTDPPYGLNFMPESTNGWDDFEPREYQEFCQDWAEEVKRVLKPGGHLIAFSGSRTHHRLNTGVEDAGFNIRDQIVWHYGSGFPKGQDIGASIDRWYDPDTEDEKRTVCEWLRGAIEDSDKTFHDVADFAGVSHSLVHAHWCASPDHEQPKLPEQSQLPDILDYIEYDIEDAPDEIIEAFHALREETGEYTEWWDEREVIGEKDSGIADAFGEEGWASNEENQSKTGHKVTRSTRELSQKWEGWSSQLKPASEFAVLAQKPKSESAIYRNCLEHGVGALNIDACRVPTDEDTSVTINHTGDYSLDGDSSNLAYSEGEKTTGGHEQGRYPSNLVLSPQAARLIDEQSGVSKSTKTDEPKGDAGVNTDKYGDNFSGEHRPETSYNDEGGASRYFPRVDSPTRFRYESKASKSERTHDGTVENSHVTVKPVDLIQWMIRLVTREGQTVLDPFAGSGTTGLAAVDEDVDAVLVEREDEYVDIIERRMEAYDENEDKPDFSFKSS